MLYVICIYFLFFIFLFDIFSTVFIYYLIFKNIITSAINFETMNILK